MFWGYFHGATKGQGIFWEKDWGSINEYSYRRYILPAIYELIDNIKEVNSI